MKMQGKRKGPTLNQPTKAFECEAMTIPHGEFFYIVSRLRCEVKSKKIRQRIGNIRRDKRGHGPRGP